MGVLSKCYHEEKGHIAAQRVPCAVKEDCFEHKDCFEREEPQNFYESGVLLENLERWRELCANLERFNSPRDQRNFPILPLF